MVIESLTGVLIATTEKATDYCDQEVATFDDGINRNTEERKEGPKERNNHPAGEELLREDIPGAIHTVLGQSCSTIPVRTYLKGHMINKARNRNRVIPRAT